MKIQPCVLMDQSGAPLVVSLSCDINTGKNESDCTNCLKCLRILCNAPNVCVPIGWINSDVTGFINVVKRGIIMMLPFCICVMVTKPPILFSYEISRIMYFCNNKIFITIIKRKILVIIFGNTAEKSDAHQQKKF